MSVSQTEPEKVRLDKWLWAARFFKTRGVALDAIKGGKIALNGHKPKPSKTVSVGDQLVVSQPHRKVIIEVLEISDKRGKAEMAEKMYRIDEEQLTPKSPVSSGVAFGYRDKGSGRPTKKDRRQLDRWEL